LANFTPGRSKIVADLHHPGKLAGSPRLQRRERHGSVRAAGEFENAFVAADEESARAGEEQVLGRDDSLRQGFAGAAREAAGACRTRAAGVRRAGVTAAIDLGVRRRAFLVRIGPGLQGRERGQRVRARASDHQRHGTATEENVPSPGVKARERIAEDHACPYHAPAETFPAATALSCKR
jgi:hypothetical protein